MNMEKFGKHFAKQRDLTDKYFTSHCSYCPSLTAIIAIYTDAHHQANQNH
jgi:hypothetical protein